MLVAREFINENIGKKIEIFDHIFIQYGNVMIPLSKYLVLCLLLQDLSRYLGLKALPKVSFEFITIALLLRVLA